MGLDKNNGDRWITQRWACCTHRRNRMRILIHSIPRRANHQLRDLRVRRFLDNTENNSRSVCDIFWETNVLLQIICVMCRKRIDALEKKAQIIGFYLVVCLWNYCWKLCCLNESEILTYLGTLPECVVTQDLWFYLF